MKKYYLRLYENQTTRYSRSSMEIVYLTRAEMKDEKEKLEYTGAIIKYFELKEVKV